MAPAANLNGLGVIPNAGGRFSFTGWPRGATNNSDVFTFVFSSEQYHEVTLSPHQYYQLQIDSVAFITQRSSTEIIQYAVLSSSDAFTSNLSGKIEPANDYDGVSDPRQFTCEVLPVQFPTALNQWKFNDGLDLSAYKNASAVYIAFKYLSSIELDAARWTIDEVNIINRTQLLTASLPF